MKTLLSKLTPSDIRWLKAAVICLIAGWTGAWVFDVVRERHELNQRIRHNLEKAEFCFLNNDSLVWAASAAPLYRLPDQNFRIRIV